MSETPVFSSELTRRPNERRFVVFGSLWRVYEDVDAENAGQGRSLVFESMSVIRRVRIYPVTWQALSDEQLYALSWSR